MTRLLMRFAASLALIASLAVAVQTASFALHQSYHSHQRAPESLNGKFLGSADEAACGYCTHLGASKVQASAHFAWASSASLQATLAVETFPFPDTARASFFPARAPPVIA